MWQRLWTCACCAIALVAAACEKQEPPPTVVPAAATTPGPVSDWRALEGSSGTAVAVEPDDPQLADAMERARATAGQALRRWRADPAGADAWAVKWAAPTVGGGVEYVWVRPLSWSRFRIEGRLASPPQADLLCGRKAGEMVSFPAEELSDWVHLLDGTFDGRREGGFTIDVLEQRHGQP